MAEGKSIYIESLGCAKNQVDSETLLALAEKAGYRIESDPMKASVVVVNTCGFIESAKKEAIDTFFTFRNALAHSTRRTRTTRGGCGVRQS